jgi:hypothetical protein
MDGTAKEGLRPFSIITSSCIPDPLFSSFFKKRLENLIPPQYFLFLELSMKKTENSFHKRTDDELTDFIK